MCDEAVALHPCTLENVPDCFVREQEIGPWDDDYHDELIKWYKGYQKRKTQKAQVKKRINAYCLASIKVVGLVCS